MRQLDKWYCNPTQCITKDCAEFGTPDTCQLRKALKSHFVDPVRNKTSEDFDYEDYECTQKLLKDGTFVTIAIDGNGLIEVCVTPKEDYDPVKDERSWSQDFYFEVV